MRDTRGNVVYAQRRRLWAAIEQEYGEPVADVIMGMRGQGCSWRTVAGALGVCRDTIIHWRHALGLPVTASRMIREEEPPRPSDQRAQALGYPSATAAIVDLRIKQRLSLNEVARRLQMHPSTISTHTPAYFKGWRYDRR